jgi:hypothetical protein
LAEFQFPDQNILLEILLNLKVNFVLRTAFSSFSNSTQHAKENTLVLLPADPLDLNFLFAIIIEANALFHQVFTGHPKYDKVSAGL